MKKGTFGMGLLAAAAMTGAAHAGTVFSFVGVSHNDAGNTAVGEAQFQLEVSDVSGDALFTLSNSGPIASVISEIYWDDDADILDSMLSINGSGVSYESVGSSVNPGNLPAGNTIAFDADFATEPNNPQPHNGVNPGDSVGILFDLDGTFAELIAAIQAGELRVGVHAQAIGQNGNSETFVTGEPTGVPTPSAAALGMILLLGAGARRRRG